MNRSLLSSGWPWLLLFGAALVLGLAAGGSSAADSPLPSVRNPGPKGAQVLSTWLQENGAQLEVRDQSLASIAESTQVLVIAAPSGRTVTQEEVASLERFVRGGGTLLYFSPRPVRGQRELAEWLGLSEAQTALPRAEETAFADLGGATVTVDVPRGLLSGAKQLRVSADTGLDVDSTDAVPVAGKTLWWRPMGKGEIWIGAGADLIENRRLDLLDNAQLWANLGHRRIAFDEFHLAAAPAPALSANLWATLAQFVFVALVFVAARGRRLGPGRPTLRREHRSILEYVSSMGALLRRAGVEAPLQLQLRTRLRRLMQERLGIALALAPEEASRLLASHTGLPTDTWARLDAQLASGSADFTRVAAEAARLEDAIVGRRAA